VNANEVNDRAGDRVVFLAHISELARAIEEINQSRYKAGRIPISQMAHTRYFRLDAEIRLLRARQDAAKPKGK